MALGGRLAGLVVLGLLLVALPGGWLAGYFILLLIALGVDLALAAAIAPIRLTRTASAAVRLGETGETVLRLRNTGSRPLRAQVRDAWVPSAGSTPRSHWVQIPRGEARTLTSALRPTRRGERPAAQVTIRSFGPLGLAARQRRVSVPGVIKVLPAFTSRRFLPEKLSRLRQIDGAVLVHQRGQGSEFDSLREYVLGDDVRAIDWRATARSGDVVVRTWRPERDRRVLIVLDTGRTSAGRVGVDPTASDPGGWPRLDWSMDAALLLAALAARAGDHVDFIAHDRVTRTGVYNASRTELLAQLVDAMAPLQPALVESDARAMVAAVQRRIRRRALVVLLTDLNASALDEGLMAVLPQLSAKHQVLLAAVSDPRVEQLAAGRADAAQVYDAAAAERARNDRRAIASRLRRSGVDVVDAPPEELAPELADHYLAMKASGRL